MPVLPFDTPKRQALTLQRSAVTTQELLPPRWQQLVRRDANGRLDPEGAVWGAPYRWGCTLVAYDQQKLARCAWSSKH